MDVLNAIKVTIPPELREMLLEFVICYLIDRPSDPHSYAAAHFMYQQKLRHSHMIRHSTSETKTASAEDDAVQKAVTPEEDKESFLWTVQDESELERKRLIPKMVRIIDDYGRPYGEKVVERLEDIFGRPETVSDETVETNDAASSLPELLDVVEEAPQPEEMDKAARREEEEVVDLEQDIEPEEEEVVEVEQEKEKLVEVVEHGAHPEEIELGAQVSAAEVAARSVVDVLHSTYQTVTDLRYSYFHADDSEEELNAMVEAQ